MKQFGVKGKMVFFGIVILIGMLAVYSLHTYRQRMLQMQRLSEATASMLAEQVMADREYYTSVVVQKTIDSGMKVSESYHDTANAIPLPATFVREVSEKIEKGGNYSLRLISLYPINSSNAPKGRFEKEALEFLLKSAEKTYSRFEEYEGRYSIRYMIPDLASKTCVDCHNNHPSSAKKDYKVGDTMGGLEVIVSMEKEKAVAIADVWRSVGYGFIFIFGTCVAGVLLTNRIIISPLVQITRAAEKLAVGELNAGVSIRSRDEIGEVGRGMNEAVKGMRNIILKTKELSANVDTAVERIAEAVTSIKKGSEDQTLAMTDVSASSEGLHKTAMDIARGMEHLTKLSFEISSSILEMSASVEEVDGSVADLTVAVGDTYVSIEEIAGSLKEVAVGIDNISRGADETASSLVEIDASAKEI
ncbi:MAG: methyl-accepting chemotaxis protein, partial [Nitrospirota bacterium]